MKDNNTTVTEVVGTDLPDMVVQQGNNALLDTGMDNILLMAKRADEYVCALKKVMGAALKITSELDWCLIGGKPYLQESGASKVARLFGISWEIEKGYPTVQVDDRGYKTYAYKMRMYFNGQFIDCEGSRSMREDFFAKSGGSIKSPDDVDERDVRMAAYTNCLANGIKRLIPSLRNIDVATLQEAGLDVSKISGYDFKKGSKGGGSGSTSGSGNGGSNAAGSGAKCACCGKAITDKVASYSKEKFGKPLCMDCQKKGGGNNTTDNIDDDPDMPFH